MSPRPWRVSRLVTTSAGDNVRRGQQTPCREVWRTRLSGRTVRGTPGPHRRIPLPAERLLGAHPRGSSRDACAHVCLCTCGVGGRTPGACTLLKRGSPSWILTSPLPPTFSGAPNQNFRRAPTMGRGPFAIFHSRNRAEGNICVHKSLLQEEPMRWIFWVKTYSFYNTGCSFQHWRSLPTLSLAWENGAKRDPEG